MTIAHRAALTTALSVSLTTVVAALVAPPSGATAPVGTRAPSPTAITPADLTVVAGDLYVPVRVGDALYYVAYPTTQTSDDEELWRTTDTGITEQVSHIDSTYAAGAVIRYLTVVGDHVVFRADDGTHGLELWQTDTSTGKTTLLTDIDTFPHRDDPGHGAYYEANGDADPEELTVVGDTVYYQADDGRTGRELWQTDLSTGDTTQTADLTPGGEYSDSHPRAFTVVGDDLLFVAATPGSGSQVWRLDTSTGDTSRLTDVPGGQVQPYFENGLQVADGSVFFTVWDKKHGDEPWSADLATGEAQMLADINPGPKGSIFFEGLVVGHHLFFPARDHSTGVELWQTNTRTGRTRQRADLQPGGHGSGSFPQELTLAGGTLYFSARARGDDQELWRLSSGRNGVKQVADVNPGRQGSWPTWTLAVGDDVYFRADQKDGPQLWRGTTSGASLVADYSSSPQTGLYTQPLLDDGGRLVFTADDRLWTLS